MAFLMNKKRLKKFASATLFSPKHNCVISNGIKVLSFDYSFSINFSEALARNYHNFIKYMKVLSEIN